MGQRNVLGSYPFHWHLLGWVNDNSYVKDCSVYHSFYRCERWPAAERAGASTGALRLLT